MKCSSARWIRTRKETPLHWKVSLVEFSSLMLTLFLQALMEKGALSNRKSSVDLLEEFDIGLLNVHSDNTSNDGDKAMSDQQFDLDEIPFEASFGEEYSPRGADSGEWMRLTVV
jgi:hypothetical protein